jgi:ATP-dependent Clp protease ATP-binding subunit ClpC
VFERYTERARRILFFARFEASQLGSVSIGTEHLLLGLVREAKGLTRLIFDHSSVSLEAIREDIDRRVLHGDKVPTSVEIPFTAETKRTLQFAAEEADRLGHDYIGSEHLLLALLREERSVAASVLMEKGMRLDAVRQEVVRLLEEKSTLPSTATCVGRLNEVRRLAEQLSAAERNGDEAKGLLARIVQTIDALKSHLT